MLSTINLIEDKEPMFLYGTGSNTKHHTWTGGLHDHTAEVLKLCMAMSAWILHYADMLSARRYNVVA